MTQRNRNNRRKSDPALPFRPTQEKVTVAAELPWGLPKVVPVVALDYSLPIGSFAGQSVLMDLFTLFERKLQNVAEEPVEKLLNKSLQRGGDPYFDNLCRTLHGISELCLPSVVNALIAWHQRMEQKINESINPGADNRVLVKKLLAVNYLFCIVLIEILPQVEFHLSACEQQVKHLLDSSFQQVQYKDPTTLGVNNTNSLVVAETYAEVIGVLSETHFTQIHKQFMAILTDLKKDSLPTVSHNMISLLMAMKFVKIKTNQVEDFEMGIKFLDDLGSFLLEVKDKDVKHAVAGLLVEILLPVAAQIKRETNIPALITFVGKLYGPTNELASKKQHKLAAYPLLTCLLCVSQRQFFLSNWVPFLNNALANLKNRDSRISRVALESLYRLLWVYMIRNNCDGNSATRTRLESICGSLFPKGNRGIVPRDAPLNIFVKIIHFIAQQKLDFAFKVRYKPLDKCFISDCMMVLLFWDVIFDLLACNRTQRSLYPERMNIGIRALMVIADGLQQKDEPPAMPKSMGPSASGTMQRLKKKTYITRPLTVDIARAIGLDQYYIPCRKAFDTILRILDTQVGRPLMMTAIQKGKDPEELLGGEVKPKLDLFRTCVAAIPRLLPEPMPYTDLIDILTRTTVHVDEELRTMAGNTLQNMLGEFPEWREHIILAEITLLQNQLTDFYPVVLDEALRLLHQMVLTWKSAALQEKKKEQEKENTEHVNHIATPLYVLNYASVLHTVEGLALVMLCQIRPQPRKIAISLLKEVKQIITILSLDNTDTPVITVLDEATPYVVRKYIEHVPMYERTSWNMDFASVCEKIAAIDTDICLVNSDKGNEYLQWDPWACALSGYAERKHLLTRCPSAVASAWPALYTRLIAVNAYVDPSNPQNENRASLLRGSKSKGSSVCGEALSQDGCLSLWQKYLVLGCAFAPSPHATSLISRSFSPTSSMETDVLRSVSSSLRASSRIPSTASLSQLFTKIAAMLRWENMIDIRDSVVLGVGSLSAAAFETFFEDLNQRGILRDAMEKKMETNVRRRKRKDLLRLQIIRIIEVAVFRGLLDSAMIDSLGSLSPIILDFIDSMRANLESDLDRDIAVVTMMRLHFSKLIAVIIDNVNPENRGNLIPDEKKQSLFYLFIGWCSRTIVADKKNRENDVGSYVEQKAALAMTRLLSCGRIFEAQKSIGEDGYLYGWLEKLVSSAKTTMQEEVEEMLAWMLELNESSHLLDWLMSQCYSQPSAVAAKCFRALVRVFSRRDFPCEFISLFVLCQAMLGDPNVADAAVHMIEILKRQFLDNSMVMSPQLASTGGNMASSPAVQLRSPVVTNSHSHCFPMDQQAVCQNLANSYPHLTITIFSEVSCRLENARSQNQTYLIALLLPWIENIELVDPVAGEDACEGPRGWGSEEATQLLLNNLMYLTVTVANDHERELAELWRRLALSFPANLPVILNYIYVVTVLSHEALLPYAKRVSVILAGVVGNRIAALLLEQLSTSSDTSRLILERSDIPPYYKWKDETTDLKKDSAVELASPMRDSPMGEHFVTGAEDASREGVRLLPMPAYGGFYSRLCALLPPTTQPVQFFTRSQVALLLICDIIRASSDVDWTEATPRLLHAAVLSLDSLRPALCRHARQTIINLALLHADQATLAHVSGMLLKHQMCGSSWDESLGYKILSSSFCEAGSTRGVSPTFAKVAGEEYRSMLLNSNAMFSSQSDLIMALIFCLSENMDTPLWPNEDATPRCWKVPSATQLTCLVRHLAELVLPSIPLLPVVWTQIAMRMALTTTQRHAAGRCFQIVSALCQPPGAWIPSLISRLVETAGETHEDTQAYVTDLLLCLLSSAPHLNPILEPPLQPSASPSHARSTSYTPALLRQSVITQRLHQEKKDARLSLLLSEEDCRVGSALMRSKSADQLKCDAEGDEEATARMQICAIAVALLESGVDNEFLLAINLLEKILDTSSPHKTRCLQKLEKTINQLDWKGFSGIVGLLSRGTVVAPAYETSIQALTRLIDVLDEPVVGGRDSLGLLICHVLPYLLYNFDTPNSLCISVCTALKQYCVDELKKLEIEQADHPLSNLATMLLQYTTKTFSKDRYQWAKCVLQYLCEAIDGSMVLQMIVLLAEMLERGASSMQAYVLHMLYLLLLRREAASASLVINAQVVRSVSRHIQGANWREAARVYKVIVEQWQNTERDNTAGSAVTSGFELDLSLVSAASGSKQSPQSPRKNTSTLDSTLTSTIGSVKKIAPPHIRVRDRLVGLLSASGLRVGLPSAVSVVFSQSELGSTASSTERICTSSQEVASTASLPEPSASITDSFPRVFKEFDFLEAEHDSVSETADSCFGWLSTMRPRSIGGDEPHHDDDADVDEDEDSESAQANSEGGGASTSRLSRTSISSERTPCPSEVDEEEDEADDGFGEVSSQAGADQKQDRLSPPSALSREVLEKRPTDRLNGVDEESLDGSSFCCRSRASLGEFYSSKATPTSPLYIQCPHHLDGKVDATWISLVAELQDDSEGELTAYATLLFTQLFRSCCGRVASLLRDAMHVFSSKPLARIFAHAQDTLSGVADCPFLFVTAQYLRCSGILPRLKLSLFELREHWETFNERKEQSIRLLNSVKSAYKLNALVGSASSLNSNSETELGKLLSKLLFQLMLMSDSLNDMVRLVDESHGAQAYTLSPAVLDHQRELLICVADLPPCDMQSSMRPEHSGDSLVLLMTNKRYAQALHTLRSLRMAFGSEFGCCEAADIDVLLLLFCRSHSLKAWALVGAAPEALRRQSQSLRDANADVASAVRRLASDVTSHRASTASSLTESFQKISYLPD